MTGAPIDSSIRRMIISKKAGKHSLPDSKTDLDESPQLIMEPGDEQFAFQYDDGLGDGRDKYPDNGTNAPATVITDTISAHIEKPKNKTYVLSYNVPFPIKILGHSHAFGTGSGLVAFQSGTINTNGSLAITVSGVSTSPAAADLLVQITVTTNQVS